MGLIQVSCNPFREKALPKINLGEIAKEVLAKHQPIFSKILVSLDSLKKEFETSQDWKKMQKEEGPDYQGVGFRYTDLLAFYGDKSKGGNCIVEKVDSSYEKVSDERLVDVKDSMNSVYDKLSHDDFSNLQCFYISIFDLIKRNSGGHPSITNITGFNFLKYNKPALKIAYGTEKYVDVLKTIAKDFVNFSKVHGLDYNTILCICEDNNGNILFGTYGGGVYQFDAKQLNNPCQLKTCKHNLLLKNGFIEHTKVISKCNHGFLVWNHINLYEFTHHTIHSEIERPTTSKTDHKNLFIYFKA
jgi:hypothetical protein